MQRSSLRFSGHENRRGQRESAWLGMELGWEVGEGGWERAEEGGEA